MKRSLRLRLVIYSLLAIALAGGGYWFSQLLRKEQQGGGALHRTRSQDPSRPYPYDEAEVKIPNPAGGVVLAGTLTLPSSAGTHPAVVLIAGTGPHERDSAQSGHRPFLVLADHLTRQGIAVLRCDRRGAGRSTGSFEQATQADFADDTRAAVEYLSRRKEIDARRIGLVGHSEGGVVALRVAAGSRQIAFVVLLASPTLPLADVVARQIEVNGSAFGVESKLLENWIATQREFFRIVTTAVDPAATEPAIRQLWQERVAPLSADERKRLGIDDSALAEMIDRAKRPGFLSAARVDPREILRTVDCPVLGMGGLKDVQVSSRENLSALRAAPGPGGHAPRETIQGADWNHLFQSAKSGLVSEYETIEETFNPRALKAISEWIRKVAPAQPASRR